MYEYFPESFQTVSHRLAGVIIAYCRHVHETSAVAQFARAPRHFLRRKMQTETLRVAAVPSARVYPCKRGVAVIVLTNHFGWYHILGSVRVKTSLFSVGCCDFLRASLLPPVSSALLPRRRVSEDKVLAVRHLHPRQGLGVYHVLRPDDPIELEEVCRDSVDFVISERLGLRVRHGPAHIVEHRGGVGPVA